MGGMIVLDKMQKVWLCVLAVVIIAAIGLYLHYAPEIAANQKRIAEAGACLAKIAEQVCAEELNTTNFKSGTTGPGITDGTKNYSLLLAGSFVCLADFNNETRQFHDPELMFSKEELSACGLMYPEQTYAWKIRLGEQQ